jgi:hypothetical protein
MSRVFHIHVPRSYLTFPLMGIRDILPLTNGSGSPTLFFQSVYNVRVFGFKLAFLKFRKESNRVVADNCIKAFPLKKLGKNISFLKHYTHFQIVGKV